jgi:hypothetical protein
MELDPVKVLKCRECGVDVIVNAKYPITEVECCPRYCPKEQDIGSKKK